MEYLMENSDQTTANNLKKPILELYARTFIIKIIVRRIELLS